MRSTKEAITIVWNDRPIVRVEGMVMIRSDLGFSPYMGYDNSRVAIYESENRSHYLIYGYKIKDNSVVTLNDLIPPRMAFTKASPIFHHWKIGDQRMGLTFSCTADGRSFDRGIRVALENLEKGSCSPSDESSSATPTSIDSFNLPAVDDVIVMSDNKSIMAQHSSSLSSPSTASSAPKFRPHAMSASSRRQLAPPVRSQRSHSSSMPDRPRINKAHAELSKPLLNPAELASSLQQSAANSHAKAAQTEDSAKSSLIVSDAVRPPPITRRHKSRQRSEGAAGNSAHRNRKTKTPNLDHLERQRDLQPTKPNSYVQIASSKNNDTRSGVGTDYFTRFSSRTNEAVHLTYSTTRFLSPRSLSDYRYRGLTCAEDSHCDFSTMPLHPVGYASSVKKNSKRSEYKRNSDKIKEDLGERSRCKNCQAMFNLDRNPPGSCPESPPDSFELCIENASCLCVPKYLYSSCSGPGDYYDQEPCTCARRHRKSSSKKRWIVYALASIVFPCLCMYPLLKSCHRCGVACQCCGGRHEPIPHSPPGSSSSSIKLS